MTRKNKCDNQLQKFIRGVVNISAFSAPILPLLVADTTATNTLRLIHRETADDDSPQGQILKQSSGALMSTLNQIDLTYRNIPTTFNQISKKNYCRDKPKKETKVHKKVKQQHFKKPKYEISPNKLVSKWNNENVNSSNLQPIIQTDTSKTRHKQTDQSIYEQLRELNRPEYRKKVVSLQSPYQQFFQYAKEITPKKGVPRGFLSSSEDYQEIPVVSRRKNIKNKPKRESSSRSNRSVSPKLEASRRIKSHLNNISQISRKTPTGSDVSFQIDLNILGILPSNKQRPLQKQTRPYQKVNSVMNQDLSRSDGIEQQEPWQCDEEELEEELRQINEKLSRRLFQTNKLQTEKDLSPQQPSPRRFNYPVTSQQQDKNTKTVRLSLTPPKHKPYQSRSKSPFPSKSPTVSSRYKTQYEYQGEIRCGKWGKVRGRP